MRTTLLIVRVIHEPRTLEECAAGCDAKLSPFIQRFIIYLVSILTNRLNNYHFGNRFRYLTEAHKMLVIDPLCWHQIGIFVKAKTQYGRARAARYFIIFSSVLPSTQSRGFLGGCTDW